MPCYTAVVPENLPAMRLERYLAEAFPLLPAHVIREAFSRRDVKVDGVRAPRGAAAARGAKVQVFTPFAVGLDVVFEDARVLLINKPAGLSVEEDGRSAMTALSLAQAHLHAPAFLCHRLDHATSGLLLLAKDEQAAQAAMDAFRAHAMQKRYICLVRGAPEPPEATARAYLLKDAQRARVCILSRPAAGAKPIATRYRTLVRGEVSRLEIDLLTGRTHQIRAHMAFLGHPLLGDDRYGDRAFNKAMRAGRLMLCASELTIHAGGALSYLDGARYAVPAPF